MAKLHHPDVSKNKHAEENFKRISKAYSMLCDPVTKKYHDQVLRDGYAPAIRRSEPARSTRSTVKTAEELRKRKAWILMQRLKHDLSFYINENQKFPYSLRLFGWFVGSMLGWQIIFLHWFVNEDSYDHIIAFGGFLGFLLCCFGILSVLYKKLRLDHYTKKKRSVDYGKRTFRISLTYLTIAIIALPVLSFVRKEHHLRHFSKTTLAKLERVMARDVEVSYIPEGSDIRIFKRRRFKGDLIFDASGKWIMVRYSTKEPRIMELVELPD